MMELVARPTIFPAACIVCGSAANGPFLDTGMHDVRGERGRVYFCANHFHEILRVEKLVPVAELEQQVARLGDALSEVVRLEEQAKQDAARIVDLDSQLTDQADVIAGRDVQIELLERRIAEQSVDPALADHQRAVAELTKPPSRRRQRAGRG